MCCLSVRLSTITMQMSWRSWLLVSNNCFPLNCSYSFRLMVVPCVCCCKLSSWNRKKASEEPVTIRGKTKAQGLRQLSSFFAFLFLFLEHFPLKLYVSTDGFLLFSLFSFSCATRFYRSLVLAVVTVHFISVPLFSFISFCYLYHWLCNCTGAPADLGWIYFCALCVFHQPHSGYFFPSPSVCLPCPAALLVLSPPSSCTQRAFQKSHKSSLPRRLVLSSV